MVMITQDLSNSLLVTMIPPVTNKRPIDGRKYTLSFCKDTSIIQLSVGIDFDYSKIHDDQQNKILAVWSNTLGHFILAVTVNVADEHIDKETAKLRYMDLQKVMELGLMAIVKGDKDIYQDFPWVLDAPIYVKYESVYPEFQKTLLYGTPRQYLRKEQKIDIKIS